MKITIKDFAPIAEASIALDGLAVIAGENDTGKSTVGRLLFSFLKAAKRGRGQRRLSYLPDYPYVRATLELVLSQVFGQDIRTGIVQFEIGGKEQEYCLDMAAGSVPSVSDNNDNIFESEELDTVIIESPLVWQLFDTFQGLAAKTFEEILISEEVHFQVPYTYFDVYLRLNGSVKPRKINVAYLLKAIEAAVKGQIIIKNNSPRFKRGDESFPMESVATGIQSFGFMQRILELGLARPGMYLILDEPEVHLHPKWQLEYAKLLVNMVHDLGMSVLLTSHSAVFVETLEFVGKKKLGDRCKFYMSERREDQSVTMRDVSDDLEPIYEKLAHPLMQLSLFQGDA